MKKIKAQKPNQRRPQMWLGYRFTEKWKKDMPPEQYRIRIIFPNGYSTYAGTLCSFDATMPKVVLKGNPHCCWDSKRFNYKQRIRAMRKYDREQGRKTMFLGNI